MGNLAMSIRIFKCSWFHLAVALLEIYHADILADVCQEKEDVQDVSGRIGCNSIKLETK